MPVSIIGSGYVGLVTGVSGREGNQVVCVDVDEAKVAAVNSTASPVFERGLNELPRGTPEGDSAPPVTYPAP